MSILSHLSICPGSPAKANQPAAAAVNTPATVFVASRTDKSNVFFFFHISLCLPMRTHAVVFSQLRWSNRGYEHSDFEFTVRSVLLSGRQPGLRPHLPQEQVRVRPHPPAACHLCLRYCFSAKFKSSFTYLLLAPIDLAGIYTAPSRRSSLALTPRGLSSSIDRSLSPIYLRAASCCCCCVLGVVVRGVIGWLID